MRRGGEGRWKEENGGRGSERNEKSGGGKKKGARRNKRLRRDERRRLYSGREKGNRKSLRLSWGINSGCDAKNHTTL